MVDGGDGSGSGAVDAAEACAGAQKRDGAGSRLTPGVGSRSDGLMYLPDQVSLAMARRAEVETGAKGAKGGLYVTNLPVDAGADDEQGQPWGCSVVWGCGIFSMCNKTSE